MNSAAHAVFDTPEAVQINKARQEAVRQLLVTLRNTFSLRTALDVGCGIGHFSYFLRDLGFSVVAADGREENISVAKLRYPEIDFRIANVETDSLTRMGSFDLVFCMGLLYHLENPFRAMRNLHGITQKILLIESMCAPGKHASMDLLDEGIAENQALNYVAFYPTETCLIKMLYRAGFSFVYSFKRLPSHELYTHTLWRKRPRTMLLASKTSLTAPNLLLAKEPVRAAYDFGPWRTSLSATRELCRTKLFGLRVLASKFLKPFRGQKGN